MYVTSKKRDRVSIPGLFSFVKKSLHELFQHAPFLVSCLCHEAYQQLLQLGDLVVEEPTDVQVDLLRAGERLHHFTFARAKPDLINTELPDNGTDRLLRGVCLAVFDVADGWIADPYPRAELFKRHALRFADGFNTFVQVIHLLVT